MSTQTDLIEKAARVTPSPRQSAWQRTEFNAFLHFGVNTFTDREWGHGTEDPAVFNPSQLDARQWVQVCKEAGMRIIILTAKHHDGFCLWPSRYTEHSVKNSPWRDGKGDVVRELADACREGGMQFGVYCSPWDRHEPSYGDSAAYNEYFRNQLRELLTNYGPIAEVWLDGACGEGPNGKQQEYDWESYYSTIHELQPEAVIAICGPDVRWVGNESGLARETEWSVVPVQGSDAAHALRIDAQAKDLGSREQLRGASDVVWYPAEVDVSIRPGWFYHASEDLLVHSLEHLVDIYYQSVGRNSVLLLNIPPDRRGLIHEQDAARLRELRRVLDTTYRTNLALGKAATADSAAGDAYAAGHAMDGSPDTYWKAAEGMTTATLEIDLGAPCTFNRLLLQEMITEGQRVEAWSLAAWHDGEWKVCAKGTTIGYKRLARFGIVTAEKVRLTIEQSRACPTLAALGLYQAEVGG